MAEGIRGHLLSFQRAVFLEPYPPPSEDPCPALRVQSASERRGDFFQYFKGSYPKSKAPTVSHMPYSLTSGLTTQDQQEGCFKSLFLSKSDKVTKCPTCTSKKMCKIHNQAHPCYDEARRCLVQSRRPHFRNSPVSGLEWNPETCYPFFFRLYCKIL